VHSYRIAWLAAAIMALACAAIAIALPRPNAAPAG
jgi:hypothetical protein